MTPALRATLASGALLASAALLAALLLTGTERLTRERIATAQRQAELAALAIVLPPGSYDNDPLDDAIMVRAPAWLGSDTPLSVRRARWQQQPSGLAIEAVAPDGYGGPIRLLVGVDAGGRISGVRVVEHRETPGLGDKIEATRGDWIGRFVGRTLGDPPLPRWTVRKHGGEFDQFAGATVTPRAVVHAVRHVLQYVRRHGTELYAAPAGDTLQHHDRLDAAAERERGSAP